MIGQPATGPRGTYSSWRRAGDWLFVAGQVPRDGNGTIIGTTVAEQTEAVIARLRAVLGEGGADLHRLVRVQAYLADMSTWAEFDAAYGRAMGGARPVRTTTGCALNEVLVEIDGVAYLGEEPSDGPGTFL